MNAVKTGLTGCTILLADEEEAAAYQAHVAGFQQEFQPVGERERTLVQNLADTQWRLDRIPGLEAGLFALGRMRYAELFAEADPQVRAALLDAHILMTEAKHFKNLHLHESRLRRQYRQDAQELKELQAERQPKQKLNPNRAAPVRKRTCPRPPMASNLQVERRRGNMLLIRWRSPPLHWPPPNPNSVIHQNFLDKRAHQS